MVQQPTLIVAYSRRELFPRVHCGYRVTRMMQLLRCLSDNWREDPLQEGVGGLMGV